jgi:hypothetical protein
MRWLIVAGVLSLLSGEALAQEISGTWQADIKPQRVFKIHETPNGYRGDIYNLGVEQPLMLRHESVSAITVSAYRIKIAKRRPTYFAK